MYNIIYNRKLNGDFPYSLEPNEDINKSITLKYLGDVYALKGAIEIYQRDGDSVFEI